jgi:pyruvate/2-oxoglutarate dehydrogenase complex dihydrolipoamide dehydrogenase (E3) component
MATSYDLVVIGATAAAEIAAISAAQTHARVAWVPNASLTPDPLLLLREGSYRFATLKRTASQSDWRLWTDTLITAGLTQPSLSVAQSYGVEHLEGAVRFEQGNVWIRKRNLRSRTYLLALHPEPTLPEIEGIHHSKVWTILQLWEQLRDQPWPQLIAVLGNGPQAVELSQSLEHLGLSVLLITGGHPLLPREDEDVTFLLQSYLEGNGIQVITQGTLQSIQQPSSADSAMLLKVGDRKYATEALVIATEENWRLPTVLEPLNLVQTQQGIVVNTALQTANAQIYAIGALLGGYHLPSVARYEAKVAVQNALFEKSSPLHYHHLPYAIFSDPPLARVGLTQAQAQHYDPQIQVLTADFRNCGGTHPGRTRAQFDQAPVGLCKMLVRKDGTILGTHILGEAAAELIHLFALAMQQGIKLQALGQLEYISLTSTQLVQHVSDQWRQRQRHHHRRNHNERLFYNRRQRSR